MTCWKWFSSMLAEANITVTNENKARIDDFIHKYIGEKSRLGQCSADWKKARAEIKENQKMKQELLTKLKALT
jgi:hypothetical protein